MRSSRYFDAGRQRSGAQIQRQVRGFFLAGQPVDHAVVADLAVDRRARSEPILSSTMARRLPMLAAVKRSKRLAASCASTKLVSQPPVLRVLLRPGVAQIAAGDHRRPRQNPVSGGAPPRGVSFEQICEFSGRMPPLLAQRFFARMRTARPSLRPVPASACVLRICLTRAGSSTPGSCTRISASLSAAAALLHAGFGQTQAVDLFARWC